ncbi:MAG TPA: hypothetical protein VF515_20395 [Candidatus Binatia bacterium]
MGRAYLSGFRAALRRWPVVLVLFLAGLASGLGFTAVTWSWLSRSLDKSFATRSLLTDLDIRVFTDLLVHHGESLQMLLVAGMILLAFFVPLGVWLNAVAVTTVGEETSLSECLARSFRAYPSYIGLWALMSALYVATVMTLFVVGRGLTRWAAESPSEMTAYWIVGACGLAGVAVGLFLATVHDHARIRIATKGVGPLRAFGWAVGFVGRREGQALPLVLLLLITSLMIWVVYRSVGLLIATDSASGVALSLLWGELLLLVRMFLRVWWFAAETYLQQVRERAAY